MFLQFINSLLYSLQVEDPYLYTEIVATFKVAYFKVTGENDGDEGMYEAMYVARLALLFSSSRNNRGVRCPYLVAEAKAYAATAKSKKSCAPSSRILFRWRRALSGRCSPRLG